MASDSSNDDAPGEAPGDAPRPMRPPRAPRPAWQRFIMKFLGSVFVSGFLSGSELVVAAGTVAGVFPISVKANVTYPLDLVNDRRHNLSRSWHEAEIWRAGK